jgi:hypothetical protein
MIPEKQFISSFCTIESGRIMVNGELYFNAPATQFTDFAKQAYNHSAIEYPKFFKMDNLSKLAFLASDLLIKDEINKDGENNIALLFANCSSSLDTDMKYMDMISDKENYHPSPSVFVYTLPNICMGEISIRYSLHTENSFFIFEKFNPDFFAGYAGVMLTIHKAEKILCGWVEFYGNDYKAFMYLVKNEGDIKHTKENIHILYNK